MTKPFINLSDDSSIRIVADNGYWLSIRDPQLFPMGFSVKLTQEVNNLSISKAFQEKYPGINMHSPLYLICKPTHKTNIVLGIAPGMRQVEQDFVVTSSLWFQTYGAAMGASLLTTTTIVDQLLRSSLGIQGIALYSPTGAYTEQLKKLCPNLITVSSVSELIRYDGNYVRIVCDDYVLTKDEIHLLETELRVNRSFQRYWLLIQESDVPSALAQNTSRIICYGDHMLNYSPYAASPKNREAMKPVITPSVYKLWGKLFIKLDSLELTLEELSEAPPEGTKCDCEDAPKNHLHFREMQVDCDGENCKASQQFACKAYTREEGWEKFAAKLESEGWEVDVADNFFLCPEHITHTRLMVV